MEDSKDELDHTHSPTKKNVSRLSVSTQYQTYQSMSCIEKKPMCFIFFSDIFMSVVVC